MSVALKNTCSYSSAATSPNSYRSPIWTLVVHIWYINHCAIIEESEDITCHNHIVTQQYGLLLYLALMQIALGTIYHLSGSDIEYEFKLSEIVSAERLVLCDRRIDRALEWRTDVLKEFHVFRIYKDNQSV